MQHYLETLNALTTEEIVNVEDYYAITLQGGVSLQGRYNVEIVKSFKAKKDVLGIVFNVEDNGYMTIQFRCNSTIVEITLT
jgi:hypothetical protein